MSFIKSILKEIQPYLFFKSRTMTEEEIGSKQILLIKKALEYFPNNTEISIGIINNDIVKYIGFRKEGDVLLEQDNNQKIFEIGSITKVFTASILAGLVCENKIKLDDKIYKFVPFENQLPRIINFEQLANHSSGLPRMPANFDFNNPDFHISWKEYDKQKLTEYLKNPIELKCNPGIKSEYSNIGSGLLGYILEHITKSSYEEMLQERIFKQYGMNNSTSQLSNILSEMVTGRDAKGKATPNWEFGVLVGAGGIYSNVCDLSKFVFAQFDDSNIGLSLTHLPTMTINKNMKIGLSWYLINFNKIKDILWHNGGTAGYTSSIALDVNNKSGVIILSNLSAFHKKMSLIDKLCLSLLETVANI